VLYARYHDIGNWGHPDDQGHICQERGMPLDECSAIVLAWAVGAPVNALFLHIFYYERHSLVSSE